MRGHGKSHGLKRFRLFFFVENVSVFRGSVVYRRFTDFVSPLQVLSVCSGSTYTHDTAHLTMIPFPHPQVFPRLAEFPCCTPTVCYALYRHLDSLFLFRPSEAHKSRG